MAEISDGRLGDGVVRIAVETPGPIGLQFSERKNKHTNLSTVAAAAKARASRVARDQRRRAALARAAEHQAAEAQREEARAEAKRQAQARIAARDKRTEYSTRRCFYEVTNAKQARWGINA